jgi:hypothetical protein
LAKFSTFTRPKEFESPWVVTADSPTGIFPFDGLHAHAVQEKKLLLLGAAAHLYLLLRMPLTNGFIGYVPGFAVMVDGLIRFALIDDFFIASSKCPSTGYQLRFTNTTLPCTLYSSSICWAMGASRRGNCLPTSGSKFPSLIKSNTFDR